MNINIKKIIYKRIRVLIISFFVFTLIIALSNCNKWQQYEWPFYLKPPPHLRIANMSSIISNCEPPYPVTFYQTTENLIGTVNYLWDFGDGTKSELQNPHHIYEVPDDYMVTLVVSNEFSSDTSYLDMSQLNQSSIPVDASFSFTHFNNNNWAPSKVFFNNLSNGANQFYWQFGDGNESSDASPSNSFENPGVYTISMTGTCSNGDFDQVSKQILISSPPQTIQIDSFNLMLPLYHNGQNIIIEFYQNMSYIGKTKPRVISVFPIKYYSSYDFMEQAVFNNIQYTSNEVLRFVVLREYDDLIYPLYEIVFPTIYLQNNFYPQAIYQIESTPFISNTFIDLFITY